MPSVQHAFDKQIVTLPLSAILPTRLLQQRTERLRKYQSILSSIRELGLIELLAVYPEAPRVQTNTHYLLLDGHLRLQALKQLGATEAICMIATDDEGYTYNRHYNRLSAVQEHRIVVAAIAKGVAPERIAEVLHINVERIRERQHLLDGIASEAQELLKDRIVGRRIFSMLRKMKPLRQVESAEMMIAANRFTSTYVQMLLATTRSDQLVDGKTRRKVTDAQPADIARMEREMEKVHQDYRIAEEEIGETMLTLVVAKGYVARLLHNAGIADYLRRHHRDLLDGLVSVTDAIATDARAPCGG